MAFPLGVRPARLSRLLRLVAAAWLVLGAWAARAQTAVSGDITTPTHWTAAGGPYRLSGNVTLREGAVLLIDPGTEIDMAADAGLTVEAGSIRASGTADRPIKVRSANDRDGAGAPGDYRAWVFTAGSADTRLEHVLFEHGSGLVVHGAAPVFNYLDIRANRGAAITVDLAASPVGVGNQASGNDLNGIAVPAGDIAGNVTWGLLGIPYVVQSGIVSVGQSPRVTAISPRTIQRGQTLTLAIDGVRLDGLAKASFDHQGLAVTPFSGSTPTRLNLQVKAAADAELGPAALGLLLDAGQVDVPGALDVTQPLPTISAVTPDTVMAGAGATEIVVTGRNFDARSEVLVNSAAIASQFVSSTEMHATLPAQSAAASWPVQVRTPDASADGQYLLSNSLTLTVQMPVPPKLSFEPTPIAMPPDGKPHQITLRLSKPDFRDHTINLSVSDATKASVDPASLVIAAGQTSGHVSVTPLAQGSVSLHADSPTLGSSSVPMFITPDFQGVNTSYAPPVGVFVDGEQTASEAKVTLQGVVGVGVGASLRDVVPGAWTVGATQAFAIHGTAIPQGSRVQFVPAEGVSVGAATVSGDGSQLTVEVSAAADAATGARRIEVIDDNGALLTFADPAQATVVLAAGLPKIDSVAPLQILRGTMATLVVHGHNLQNGRISLEPADGIEVDAQPQISDDGTLVTASLHVAADAPLGARVVRIATAAGTSEAAAASQNTLAVVGNPPVPYTSVTSTVGVLVGSPEPPADPVTVAPILTSNVGVVLGATATGVEPRRGIIGTSLQVTVHGQGLAAVSGVRMVPADGLAIGTPNVNADGTALTFSLQVDGAAAVGLRRLVLETDAGPLAFANVMDGAFLVSAPIPEVSSVDPLVLARGGDAQTLLLRGRYLDNVTDVRLEPADGVTINRPYTASDDGSSLGVAVLVAADAPTGPRTVVVTTAAGQSDAAQVPGNTVTIASEIGTTYPAIVSGTVGVTVGSDGRLPASYDGAVVAPGVGVLIPQPEPEPITADTQAVAPAVRLLVGAVATATDTDGWLQGASGTLTVEGVDLGQVTSVGASPSTGVLFDAVSVEVSGTRLTVPVSVAQDAPLGSRQLHLYTATGEVAWSDVAASGFGIGRVPSMDSVTPIVLTAGQTVTLSIRGHDLSSVTGAMLLPGEGATLVGAPAWSQDSLGELLQVTLRLDADAPTGSRVLQLKVPGGATSATPSPVNTLTVVAPQ
jgi:hypothetical protein